MDRALHESGNYISVMFSSDTTNKESGTKLNYYYIIIIIIIIIIITLMYCYNDM